MNTVYESRFDKISGMIGKTPLLEIHFTYKGEPRRIFAKAEYFNLSGSIKDRVAFHIMKKAYEKGEIAPDDIIAEATSGNTGIAFSAMGSYLGHKVVIYMPDWMSAERINLMKSFGAEVRLVSREEGGFLGSIAMTEKLAEGGGVFPVSSPMRTTPKPIISTQVRKYPVSWRLWDLKRTGLWQVWAQAEL